MAPQPRITHSPPPVNDAKSPRSCPSLVERRTVEKWGRVGQRLHLGVSVRRRLRKGHVEKRNKGREGEDALVKQVLRCVCQAGMFNDHFQTWLWVRAHHWVLARVGRSPGRGGFALRRPSMALLGHAVGREGGSAGNEGNSASA